MKSIGTFLGQFYGFVMENLYLVSFLIIHYFAGGQKDDFIALINIAKFVEFGLVSAVEVFSSPVLRRTLRSKIKKE